MCVLEEVLVSLSGMYTIHVQTQLCQFLKKHTSPEALQDIFYATSTAASLGSSCNVRSSLTCLSSPYSSSLPLLLISSPSHYLLPHPISQFCLLLLLLLLFCTSSLFLPVHMYLQVKYGGLKKQLTSLLSSETNNVTEIYYIVLSLDNIGAKGCTTCTCIYACKVV